MSALGIRKHTVAVNVSQPKAEQQEAILDEPMSLSGSPVERLSHHKKFH
jgi:hypothetical protein